MKVPKNWLAGAKQQSRNEEKEVREDRLNQSKLKLSVLARTSQAREWDHAKCLRALDLWKLGLWTQMQRKTVAWGYRSQDAVDRFYLASLPPDTHSPSVGDNSQALWI